MLRFASWFVLALALTACDQGNGIVRGAALDVPGCKTAGETHRFEPFTMTLNLFTVAEHGNLGTVRIGQKAGRIHEIDQVGISLWDVGALKEGIKAGPVTLTLHPGTADGEAAAYTDGATLAFTLMGKCPHAGAALGTTGTLTFERYSAKDAARVEGTFLVDVIDRRSGAVLGTGLAGEFGFDVETASPATAFQPENF